MEQRSPDQLVEWAYDQFLEQAADMLAPEQIVDITLEFEQRGAVEATLPNADWSTELGEPVDMARWAEVWVGLLDHQDEFEVIYATFLLPRIRASTTCISAGTASNRHKKRRPRRLFVLRCPSQGRAAMALARQRRHQQALASLMGNAGSWLHQQRSMGSPPTRRRTPARRSPGRHECSSSHRARPCGPAGPRCPWWTTGLSRSGCGHNRGRALFGPAVTDAGDSATYSSPAGVSGATRRMLCSSMTILPCL